MVQVVAPSGPLVLVGHSRRLYANALAHLARTRARGLALVDPVHPDNGRFQRELPPNLFRRDGCDLTVRYRMARVLTRLRRARLVKALLMRNPPSGRLARTDAEHVIILRRQLLSGDTHLGRSARVDTATGTGHSFHPEKPETVRAVVTELIDQAM
ncbi:MAG: hypothetical protein ABIQ18_44540 [Umezawaea sp.]